MSRDEALVLLGLEGSPGRKEIRAAYARMVREHHPEDDPDGFARIRAAYELLLAAVSEPVPPSALEPERDSRTDLDFGVLDQEISADLETKTRLIIERMREIYDVIEFRRDPAQWDLCFRMKTFREIKNTQAFQKACLDFFAAHFHFPAAVWVYLCRSLGLVPLIARGARWERLRGWLGELLAVPEAYRATFEFLRSSTPRDALDAYLEKLLWIQVYFSRGDTVQARSLFRQAVQVLDGDWELYAAAARFFQDCGDRAAAESIYSAAKAKGGGVYLERGARRD